MKKTVIELFAGVGGFRVGLNNVEIIDENGHAIENGDWSFVWANQWEPATKSQEAFECYNTRFNESNNSFFYCKRKYMFFFVFEDGHSQQHLLLSTQRHILSH